MPYLYQEILPDGTDGDSFEIIQRMSELHDEASDSVNPSEKFSRPQTPTKYTERETKLRQRRKAGSRVMKRIR